MSVSRSVGRSFAGFISLSHTTRRRIITICTTNNRAYLVFINRKTSPHLQVWMCRTLLPDINMHLCACIYRTYINRYAGQLHECGISNGASHQPAHCPEPNEGRQRKRPTAAAETATARRAAVMFVCVSVSIAFRFRVEK